MKFIIASLLLLVLTPLKADVIKLRADVWCPYTCEHGSDLPGYIVEAARIIFEDAGHSVDYKTMNWSRTLREVRSGLLHGAIGASKDETPDFIHPSLEQGSYKDAFWGRLDEKWEYTGLASLTDVRLGVTAGYDYGEELAPIIKKKPKNFQYATGDDPIKRNLRKLLANRVDTILVETNVMKFTSMIMQLKGKVKKTGEIKVKNLSDQNLYIAFSPNHLKSKEYAKILSIGWKKLRENGKLARIMGKYGLQDWK